MANTDNPHPARRYPPPTPRPMPPIGTYVYYRGAANELPWTRRRDTPGLVLDHLPNGSVKVEDGASLLGWYAVPAAQLAPAELDGSY